MIASWRSDDPGWKDVVPEDPPPQLTSPPQPCTEESGADVAPAPRAAADRDRIELELQRVRSSLDAALMYLARLRAMAPIQFWGHLMLDLHWEVQHAKSTTRFVITHLDDQLDVSASSTAAPPTSLPEPLDADTEGPTET